MSLRIMGTGSALPAKVTTNFDLAKIVDTSDEWIVTRTGIKERRICSEEENSYTLGVSAAQAALEAAGTPASSLTMIICSSVVPDSIIPPLACRIMGELGAQCPAFDINVACTGFLYALSIADAMATGPVLIICAEQTSRYIDFTDRRTCVLFGDGAGAAVVEPGEGLLHLEIRGKHDAAHSLYMPGVNHRERDGGIAPSYMTMDGQEVFKFATREMMDLLKCAFAATGLKQEDFARVIPHQANIRIIKSSAERLGIPLEKFRINMSRLGNTSSASIPIALDEMIREGALVKGDKALLVAFGAGWTSGAAAIAL